MFKNPGAKLFFFNNRQSEYKIFYKLMNWLAVWLVDILSWWGPLQRGELVRRVTGQLATVFSVFVWDCLVRGGWSNGFRWDYKFVRCLIRLAWMMSCTVGILRSAWIISVVTYRGASTVARNILDWHLCTTAILDLQTQPHTSMPYVHI
jgi:hypothetical protein